MLTNVTGALLVSAVTLLFGSQPAQSQSAQARCLSIPDIDRRIECFEGRLQPEETDRLTRPSSSQQAPPPRTVAPHISQPVAPAQSMPRPPETSQPSASGEQKYASTNPTQLQQSQRIRDALFKSLQASTKQYAFTYLVITVPAGTLPGINHSVPVSFVRYDSAALFAFDRHHLEAPSEKIIIDFAKTLLKDKSYRSVVIVGHTDSVGTDEYNGELSKRRAITVANALRASGIPETNLGIVPMGKSQPAETNSTDQGRARNRRVEFFISDVVGAPEAAISDRPLNPCHLRDDCAPEERRIPVLGPLGDQKHLLVLRRSLPKNSGDDFVRAPLPTIELQRRSLKDLQKSEEAPHAQ